VNQEERNTELNCFLRKIREMVDIYPRLTHSWRFAASAVWAMRHYYATHAAQPPPQQRFDEDKFVQDTKTNIDALLENKDFSQDWMRGFWFNAAIMRLDALWERCFKLFVSPDYEYDGPCLYALVQTHRATPSSDEYKDSTFGRVRKIVNSLKHRTGGAKPKIREDRDLPMNMLRDLLAVISDRDLKKMLESLGKGPVLTGSLKRKR
jgi:hypothetical protein